MNNTFVELPTNNPGTVKSSANNNFTSLDVFSTPPSREDIINTPYQVTPLNKIEGVGRYLNSSTYKKIGFSMSPELEDKYYKETPWYNQIGNATAQFFGQAGAAFEAQMSKLEQIKQTFGTTDGDYLKDAFKASEDLREKYPVFKSSNETYGILGYTPFGDDAFSKWSNFIPNLGFTAGTMAGVFLENVVASAIIEATTGGTATPLLPAKWLKGLYEGVKAIKSANDIKKLASVANIGKGIYETEKILGTAGNVFRGYEAIKAGKSLNGALHSIYGGYQLYSAAAGEALIENANSVGEVMKDFKDDFILKNGREPNGTELARMQEAAEGIILPSSLGNIGILMASNGLQEMNAFKAGKSLSSFVLNGSKRLGEAVSKRVVLDNANGLYREVLANEIRKETFKSIGRGALTVFSEGLEESAQGIVAESTKNYFKAKYYDKPITWTDALGQGFAYASSDQGMEEFYAGIVTGGIFSGGGYALNQYQLKRDEKANFLKTGRTIKETAQDQIADLNEVIPLIKFSLATSQSSENIKVQTVIQQQIKEAYEKGDLRKVELYKRQALHKAMFTAKSYGKDEELIKHYENLKSLEKNDLAKYLNIEESELANEEEMNKTISYLKDSSAFIDYTAKTFPNPAKKTRLSDPKYADMSAEEREKAYLEDNALFEAWQGAQELLAGQYFLLKDLQEQQSKLKLNLEGTNMPMDLLAAIMASSDEASEIAKDLQSTKIERDRISQEIKYLKDINDKKGAKALSEPLKEVLAEIKELEEKLTTFENPNENAQVNYLIELSKRMNEVKNTLDLLKQSETKDEKAIEKYSNDFLNLFLEYKIIASDAPKEEKIEQINGLRPEDKKLKFNLGNLLSSEDSIKSIEDLINTYNLLGSVKQDIDFSENIIDTLNSKEKMAKYAGDMFSRIYEARKRLFSNIKEDKTDEVKDTEKEKEVVETKGETKKKPIFKPGSKVIYNEKEYEIKSIKFRDGDSIYTLEDSDKNTIEVVGNKDFTSPEEKEVPKEKRLKVESTLEKEKEKITADEFKELLRLAKYLRENPKEPVGPNSVVNKYPSLFKEINKIEEDKNEEIMSELAKVQDEDAFTGGRELTEEEKKQQKEIIDSVTNKYELELKNLQDSIKAFSDIKAKRNDKSNVKKETTKEQTEQKEFTDKKLEFLNENIGRVVTLNGIKGILTKVNDGIYEVETENRIYEFPIDTIDTFDVPVQIVPGNTTEQPVGPKEVKKYKVSNVTEKEVTVNNVNYLINTDVKGNIVSLSPVNNPTQQIKNEKLLIAVEIERNKEILETNADNQKTVDKLKTNYPNLDKMLDDIWSINLTDTISSALDKLYDKQPLTEQEALQTAIWLRDVFERISEFIKPNNSKQENDTILQAYNTAEIIDALLYDLNNITTNHDENRKTATDVEQVKDTVSTKRSKGRITKQGKTQIKEKKGKTISGEEVLEKGPTEKLIDDLKSLKEFVNNSEDLEKDMDRIFETLNEKEYKEWQDTLDPDTIEQDLKEPLSKLKTPKEVGNAVSNYLLNRFIDTQIEQLGQSSLSEKKEEQVIKTEPGNSGNINGTDAKDSLDPVDEKDAEAPLKSREEFIQDIVNKISNSSLTGEDLDLTKEEKQFYENNKDEIQALVDNKVNEKETKEEEDEVLETKKDFLDEFNKLLLLTGQTISESESLVYKILKRIKFSIAEQWYKFKDKDVSVNLKKVLESLAKKYTNVSFTNVGKEYINSEGKTGVELYVNRIINNSVKEAYDKFELFRHQHSLHLDINEENTELIMDKLMKFANENPVYILVGSAYNISRPDNIRIYSKDGKLSTEVLDNLMSSIAGITSYQIDNPVIDDIQYELLPTTESLVKFINSVDSDIKNEILNYLGFRKADDRAFLDPKNKKNYKNGLSLNSLAAAKLFVKAYDKFKLSGKIQRQYIIAPVIDHQIRKAAFYGEIKALYNELVSNPMFKDIVNRKYFKDLIEQAAQKMEKLKVFNFASRTLSIGDTIYDNKNKEYTIIDNTLLGKEVKELKEKEVKFQKVLKIQDKETKEEKLVTQYEFKNLYSLQPTPEISSPEDLKEQNKKEKERNETSLLPNTLFTTISNDTDIFFVRTDNRREKREEVDQNSAIGRLVLQRIADSSSSSQERTKIKVETPEYDKEDSIFYIEPGKRNPNVPERIEQFILEKLNDRKFSELNPEELEEIKGFFGKVVTIVNKKGEYIKYDKNGLADDNGIVPLYFLPKGDLVISGDTISYGGRVLMPISTMVEKLKLTEEEIKQRATREAEQLNNLHSSTEPIYLSLSSVSNGIVDEEDIIKYNDVKDLDKESKLKFEMTRDKNQKGEIFMTLNGTSIKLKQKAMGEDMALAILAYLGVEDGYFLRKGFKVGRGIKERYNKLKSEMKELEDSGNKLAGYKARIEYLNFLNRTVFMSMKNFEIIFDTYFTFNSKPEIFEAIALRDYNTDKSEPGGIPNLLPIGDTWKRMNNNKNNDDYYSYLDTIVALLSKVVFDTNPDFVQSTNNDNFVSMDNTLDIRKVYVKEYLMDKYQVRGILVNESLLNSKNRYVILDTPAKKETPVVTKKLENMDLNELADLMRQEEMDDDLRSLSSITRSKKASLGRKDLPASEKYKQDRIGEIRNALNNVNSVLSKVDSDDMKKRMKEAKTEAEVNKVQMDILEKYNCKIG